MQKRIISCASKTIRRNSKLRYSLCSQKKTGFIYLISKAISNRMTVMAEKNTENVFVMPLLPGAFYAGWKGIKL